MFFNGSPLYYARVAGRLRLSAMFVAALMLSSVSVLAADHAESLSKTFDRAIDDYYRELSTRQASRLKLKSVKALYAQVRDALKRENNTTAVTLMLANMDLITQDIDSGHSAYFVNTLLENNITLQGKKLAQYAIANGNFDTASKVNYQLASYYFNQDELTLATTYLTSIDAKEALTEKEQDYATLIFGIAIQKSKKHREAMKIYDKIEKSSYYYSYAQLNTAIANIRQGWWTDGHIAIENAISSDIPDELRELRDRLLVVLAYSQIQNEFYRNARKTFGKIGLDSVYVDKALLGLGLCALYQKDYVGAVNAFNRLMQQSNNESLSVIEAHLLVPYSLDKMGESDEAASGYAEAISFFESKMFLLDAQLLSLAQAGSIPLTASMRGNLPKKLLKMKLLLENIDASQNSKLTKRIRTLEDKVNREIADELRAQINEKKASIKSYISQSQYGLAKLYDK